MSLGWYSLVSVLILECRTVQFCIKASPHPPVFRLISNLLLHAFEFLCDDIKSFLLLYGFQPC